MLEEEDEWGGVRWRRRSKVEAESADERCLCKRSSTNGVSESKVNIRYVGYLYRL